MIPEGNVIRVNFNLEDLGAQFWLSQKFQKTIQKLFKYLNNNPTKKTESPM